MTGDEQRLLAAVAESRGRTIHDTGRRDGHIRGLDVVGRVVTSVASTVVSTSMPAASVSSTAAVTP
jgi:hypothetical protein